MFSEGILPRRGKRYLVVLLHRIDIRGRYFPTVSFVVKVKTSCERFFLTLLLIQANSRLASMSASNKVVDLQFDLVLVRLITEKLQKIVSS